MYCQFLKQSEGKQELTSYQFDQETARSDLEGKQELTSYQFDQETARSDLAKAIVMHEYPLSIVDHIGFRRFLASLQPIFVCPTRNTIKSDILKIYDFEKGKTKKLIDGNESRVVITTDMWTASNQRRGFMTVTAHYIDSTWTLQSRILRFIYVPSPHTKEVLCDYLLDCLMDWNVDRKLSTVTLDNCFTNDAMIVKVMEKLEWEDLMLSDWGDSDDDIIRQMASSMMNKFDKYWDEIHGIMGVAAVLDPRYKMSLLDFNFRELYPCNYYDHIDKIHQYCYDLVNEYQCRFDQENEISTTSQTNIPPSFGSKRMSAYLLYVKTAKRSKSSYIKIELDHYLEEEVIPWTEEFDILFWWKQNGLKYPTLQAIAKDILAIPVSMVASKSAFSTSGRLISPHRSRLHPKTLEALMCAQNWLWASEKVEGLKSTEGYSTIYEDVVNDDEGSTCTTAIEILGVGS